MRGNIYVSSCAEIIDDILEFLVHFCNYRVCICPEKNPTHCEGGSGVGYISLVHKCVHLALMFPSIWWELEWTDIYKMNPEMNTSTCSFPPKTKARCGCALVSFYLVWKRSSELFWFRVIYLSCGQASCFLCSSWCSELTYWHTSECRDHLRKCSFISKKTKKTISSIQALDDLLELLYRINITQYLAIISS